MIVIDRPPNFEMIRLHFPDADKAGVVFAYDGKIYSPHAATLPPALVAHETVHLERQRALGPGPKAVTVWSGPDLWWRLYCEDSEFRYHEELLAHVAEFKMLKNSKDRNLGARLLLSTALRLTAPLYRYQPPRTVPQALKDLQREIAK